MIETVINIGLMLALVPLAVLVLVGKCDKYIAGFIAYRNVEEKANITRVRIIIAAYLIIVLISTILLVISDCEIEWIGVYAFVIVLSSMAAVLKSNNSMKK